MASPSQVRPTVVFQRRSRVRAEVRRPLCTITYWVPSSPGGETKVRSGEAAARGSQGSAEQPSGARPAAKHPTMTIRGEGTVANGGTGPDRGQETRANAATGAPNPP